jgi:hypothetical protein
MEREHCVHRWDGPIPMIFPPPPMTDYCCFCGEKRTRKRSAVEHGSFLQEPKVAYEDTGQFFVGEACPARKQGGGT